MAEEGSSSDRAVEISEDGVDQMITDLENRNGEINRENKEYKKQIEDLKSSLEEFRAENKELKKEVEKAESENKLLEVVAARTAELETEVSRLHQDLVSATNNLQESTVELSNLKKELEGIKGRDKEKDVKLEAFEKERALLMVKVEETTKAEKSLRDELQAKENEIHFLKKNVEASRAVLAVKNELEKALEELKGESSDLKSRLTEKEKAIGAIEAKERAIQDAVNGGTTRDALVGDGKKDSLGGVRQNDVVVIGGSIFAAAAVIGAVCWIAVARKH